MRGRMTCAGMGGLLIAASWAGPALGDEKVTFVDHVLPIFQASCLSCHNPDKARGGVSLASHRETLAGGSSGQIIAPGQPDSSRLYLLIAHKEKPFMPLGGDKIPDAQIEVVRRWIAGGALENAGSKPLEPAKPRLELALSGSATTRPSGPPPMPEAVSRQPATRTARPNAITALAASPWSPLAAIAGETQVLLHDLGTLDLVGVLPFPEGDLKVLRFSRSGELLIAAGGHAAKHGKVVVWDVRGGGRIVELGSELDAVLAADVDAACTRVALGGSAKVIRVVDLGGGPPVFEIKKHTEWIFATAFSPDGVLLATADRNGGLLVWEAKTGREYLSLAGHPAAITALSWRLDSNILASAGEDGTLRLWEMEDGKEVKSWPAHAGGALCVDFARDGRLVSCGRDRLVKVWKPDGTLDRQMDPFEDIALRCAWDESGSRVVAGDFRGEIRVYQAADGKLVARLDANPPTIQERLASAQQDLAAKKAGLSALEASTALAKAEADKKTVELASAQQAAAAAQQAIGGAVQAEATAKAAMDEARRQLADAQGRLQTGRAATQAASQPASTRSSQPATAASQTTTGPATTAATRDAGLAALEAAVASLAATAQAAEARWSAAQKATEAARADAASKAQAVERLAAEQKSLATRPAALGPETDKARQAAAEAQAAVDKWLASLALEESLKHVEAMRTRQAQTEQAAQAAEAAVAAARRKLEEAAAETRAAGERVAQGRAETQKAAMAVTTARAAAKAAATRIGTQPAR